MSFRTRSSSTSVQPTLEQDRDELLLNEPEVKPESSSGGMKKTSTLPPKMDPTAAFAAFRRRESSANRSGGGCGGRLVRGASRRDIARSKAAAAVLLENFGVRRNSGVSDWRSFDRACSDGAKQEDDEDKGTREGQEPQAFTELHIK